MFLLGRKFKEGVSAEEGYRQGSKEGFLIGVLLGAIGGSLLTGVIMFIAPLL